MSRIVRLIADRHGAEMAERFCAAFGGLDLCVPTDAAADHRVAVACGVEVLRTLVEQFGGQVVIVPLGPAGRRYKAQLALEEAVREGLPTGEIIGRLHVTRRAVLQARRRVRSEAPLGARSDPS